MGSERCNITCVQAPSSVRKGRATPGIHRTCASRIDLVCYPRFCVTPQELGDPSRETGDSENGNAFLASLKHMIVDVILGNAGIHNGC